LPAGVQEGGAALAIELVPGERIPEPLAKRVVTVLMDAPYEHVLAAPTLDTKLNFRFIGTDSLAATRQPTGSRERRGGHASRLGRGSAQAVLDGAR
jgi:hypothetical protein